MATDSQILTGRQADLFMSKLGLPPVKEAQVPRTVVARRDQPRQEPSQGQEAASKQPDAEAEQQAAADIPPETEGENTVEADQVQGEGDSAQDLDGLDERAQAIIRAARQQAEAADKRARGQQSSAEKRVAALENDMKVLVAELQQERQRQQASQVQAELAQALPPSDEEYVTAGGLKRVIAAAGKVAPKQVQPPVDPRVAQFDREAQELVAKINSDPGAKKVRDYANQKMADDPVLKGLMPLQAFEYVKATMDREAQAFARAKAEIKKTQSQQQDRLGTLPPQRTSTGMTAPVKRGTEPKSRLEAILQNPRYNGNGAAIVRKPS